MSAMKLYLISRKFYQKKLTFFAKVFFRLNCFINATSLPYTADIDPSVVFVHNGLGVVIHCRAIIKGGCTIMQNVTIGGNAFQGGTFDLVIDENVYIGAGAVILSSEPMIIGKNARIGANAVVLKSVPDNCTAVGVPARIIQRAVEES